MILKYPLKIVCQIFILSLWLKYNFLVFVINQKQHFYLPGSGRQSNKKCILFFNFVLNAKLVYESLDSQFVFPNLILELCKF